MFYSLSQKLASLLGLVALCGLSAGDLHGAACRQITVVGEFAGKASLDGMLEVFVERPIDDALLEAVADTVQAHLLRHDYPATLVSASRGAATGSVEVTTAIGQLSSASVEGRYRQQWSLSALAEAVEPLIHQPIRSAEWQEALDWLRRDPLLSLWPEPVAGAVTESDAFPVDVILHLDESRPWRLALGLDTRGVSPLSQERFFITGEWSHPLGTGHRLMASLMADPEWGDFWAPSMAYTIPLSWRHELHLFGGGMWTESIHRHDAENYELSGESFFGGLHYRVPWRMNERTTGEGWLGWEGRRYTTSIGFGGGAGGLGSGAVVSFDRALSLSLLTLGQRALWSAGPWQLMMQGQGWWSPGTALGSSSTSEWQAVSPGTEEDFFYGRVDVTVRRDVGERGRWGALSVRGTSQWAADPLPQSERISLSALDAVRGARERLVSGSCGYYGSLEYGGPWLSWKKEDAAVQAYVFADGGEAREPGALGLPGASLTQTALGVGCRWRWGAALSADTAVAWPHFDGSSGSGAAALPTDPQWHLSVRLTF